MERANIDKFIGMFSDRKLSSKKLYILRGLWRGKGLPETEP
jgi:hypothetical protein